MFDSGAGLLVTESHGVLAIMVLLTPEFNESYAVILFILNFILQYPYGADFFGTGYDEFGRSTANVRKEYLDQILPPSTLQYSGGAQRFVTVGLLGTFNDNHRDDLMSPSGHITQLNHPPSENDNINAYNFGQQCNFFVNKTKI